MSNSNLLINRFRAFKDQHGKSSSYIRLLESIEALYHTFRKYHKPTNLTCLDSIRGDCDQISRLVLSYNVRSIPEELIVELEFYGDDESWGTTIEVKYLLPRILEHIAIDFLYVCTDGLHYKAYHLRYGLDHGFCKYKLSQMKNWPKQEQAVVLEFVYNLFEFLANNCNDLNDFIIDLCQSLPLDGERFIKIWDKAPNERKNDQFRNFINGNLHHKTHALKDIYIGNVNVTTWVIQDKHILEFNFFFEDRYFYLIQNRAKYNATNPAEISCGVMPIALFGKEARVLILKQTFAGEDYWGFPKGHKEEWENDMETASRELKEETNLEISQLIREAPFECSYSFMRGGVSVAKRAKYFLAYVKQPESLVLNSEGLDFKWVPIDSAQNYLSHDTTVVVWKEAINHLCKAGVITSLRGP